MRGGKIMRIIRDYFTLHFYQWQRVGFASVQIKRGVRISEGQIIWAIL